MKPTCIYIFILRVLLVLQDRVECYVTGLRYKSSDCLTLARYRKYITVLLSFGTYKWWKGKMVSGQGYGLGIGGCKRLCPAANGA